MTQKPKNSLDQLKQALDAGLIDQATYDKAKAGIIAQLTGDGAIAQGLDALAVGTRGVAVDGDNLAPINTGQNFEAQEGAQIIYAEEGATVVIGDAPVEMTAVNRQSLLGRYLQHIISQNRYLQLQGIRSGGKLVNIELDRIYITLRTTQQRTERTDVVWLAAEAAPAPGETHRNRQKDSLRDISQVSVNQALAEHKRLVVLGDPGCGKTTLLRYLALLFARDLAEDSEQVAKKLSIVESGSLPVFLPLRQIGLYLNKHHPKDDGTEGHAILLRFFVQMLEYERIEVEPEFFDDWLKNGKAAVLLDGLDEVADPQLRRRVSRLVDAFTRAYPDCRYVVTSRIVGYTDASQLCEGYATTRVCDFSMDDVKRFLTQWHRLVAVGQLGPGETAEAFAASQTRQLLESIEQKDRVRELAINPLMLTVIALVHRDRVKLPDRRSELYQEAIDVLLGKWDEARGVQDTLDINGRAFDISDRRLMLQYVALTMHEQAIKEIDAEPLYNLLAVQLEDAVADPRELDATVTELLKVIRERTGLLIARAEGTYAFSHLTFQEYLAALGVAARDDYIAYTLQRTEDEWWREVILLEAGYLSTQSKEKTTRLIRAIAEHKAEPAPYHNLVLAAECVRDAGANRILGDLETELRARLRQELEAPVASGPLARFRSLLTRGMSVEAVTRRRIAAAEALGKIGGSQFWNPPHGEPEWVWIPAGEFTMGEGHEAHRLHLPEFAIARVPVTNLQYQLFVQTSGYEPPAEWNGKRAPKGKESHPVTHVSWYDAVAYCRWLSEITLKPITLPSEAEWEKAARGADDSRVYPWGDDFDRARCNVWESGFGNTTPVGIFANGASPYGCLDMAGNVWEWTRSLWGKDINEPTFTYPYDPNDGKREDLTAGNDQLRVVRGGSWHLPSVFARCAYRLRFPPEDRYDLLGFRVVLRSAPVV
jgi:formylglycine-generating enzyme required for sulfatase activity/energy-coupling factor transporter ATP-binding protein EcfA2